MAHPRMYDDANPALKRLREICLALPAAYEKEAWGECTFRVTGGSMFAMSYYGANRVVPNYNVMGPVKAALEASCRYLAYELGPKGIRVHPISPGPLKTRAASGLKDFDLLLSEAERVDGRARVLRQEGHDAYAMRFEGLLEPARDRLLQALASAPPLN